MNSYSGAWLHCWQWSHAPLLDEKQQNAASHETPVSCEFYPSKTIFLGYQTLINVAGGEPRPQPRSQTATSGRWKHIRKTAWCGASS